jgi:hypothetical protein
MRVGRARPYVCIQAYLGETLNIKSKHLEITFTFSFFAII